MHVIDDFTYYSVLENADEIIDNENSENVSKWIDDLGWL